MDLILDPQTLGDLHRALCEAFTDPEALKRLAKYRLGLSMAELAGETNLKVMADRLIEAVQASGRLTQLLRQACRENPGAQRLRTLEKKLLPRFSTEQLQALDKLLPVPEPKLEQLEALAEESAPAGWMFPLPVDQEGAPMGFSRLADSLSSAPEPVSGAHPLHGFAARLAARFPQAAPALEQWIRDTGGQVRPVPAGDKVSALHLFVKCDSGELASLAPGDSLLVTAWLWQLGPDGKPLAPIPKLVIDHQACKLEALPELVSQTRKTQWFADQLRKARDRMTVEVCIRQALLAEAVEDWSISVGKTPTRLGLKYPVVLRSYERLYEQRDVWGAWNDKWERLKQLVGTPPEPPVIWVGPDEESETLFEMLMAPHVVAVASRQRCTPELFQVSMDGGAPVMVWLRVPDARPEDVEACLAPLLSASPLRELPKRIHQARLDAKKGELVRHITLVWDDYDRLPPDVEDDSALSAPPVK